MHIYHQDHKIEVLNQDGKPHGFIHPKGIDDIQQAEDIGPGPGSDWLFKCAKDLIDQGKCK